MLVNDFFARMMNEADDKTVLFLARILFYNINNLEDRDKFLERADIVPCRTCIHHMTVDF